MSFFSRLFRRNTRNNNRSKTRLRDLFQQFSRISSSVRFSARSRSDDVKAKVQRFVNDNSISNDAKISLLEKVIPVLNNFQSTYELTGEPINDIDVEALYYAIVGWSSMETNKILCSLTDIVQELLTNNSIRMTPEDRKSILDALIECRNACTLRLARNGYTQEHEKLILQITDSVKLDLTGGAGVNTIVDSITVLRDELNWVIGGDDIKLPDFTDLQSFFDTFENASRAFQNKIQAADNELQRIIRDKDSIIEIFGTLTPNDPRKNSLSRKFDILGIKEQAVTATNQVLTEQQMRLAFLSSYINSNTLPELLGNKELAKQFKNSTFAEVLGRKFSEIVDILKALYDMNRTENYDFSSASIVRNAGQQQQTGMSALEKASLARQQQNQQQSEETTSNDQTTRVSH